jgi:hypothetical protein
VTLKRLLTAAFALALGAAGILGSGSASAADPGCGPGFVACFDRAGGQTPENIVGEPDGAFDVTFSLAGQVARVGLDGRVRILAAVPLPSGCQVTPLPVGCGATTPLVHHPVTMGLTRAEDGTLYFLYANRDLHLTGVWRLRPHRSTPERIAALPDESLPNGIALDERSGALYLSDSALGRVWTVPRSGGTPTVFSDKPALGGTGFAANGLKLHHHAVWVSDSATGTILRIPILPGNRAGEPEPRASDLATVDDFTFTGHGDELLAAVSESDSLVLVRPRPHPDGRENTTVLQGHGLQNPTSLVIRDGAAYVASGAYFTEPDPQPNLLRVPLGD